jgi:hypothetical protein
MCPIIRAEDPVYKEDRQLWLSVITGGTQVMLNGVISSVAHANAGAGTTVVHLKGAGS